MKGGKRSEARRCYVQTETPPRTTPCSRYPPRPVLVAAPPSRGCSGNLLLKSATRKIRAISTRDEQSSRRTDRRVAAKIKPPASSETKLPRRACGEGGRWSPDAVGHDFFGDLLLKSGRFSVLFVCFVFIPFIISVATFR